MEQEPWNDEHHGEESADTDDQEETIAPSILYRTTPRRVALRVLVLLFLAGLWFAVTELFTRKGLETEYQVETVASKQKYQSSSAKNASTKTVAIAATNDNSTTQHNTQQVPLTGTNTINNKQTKKNTTATASTRDRLVISMKTMPSRIGYIQPTLDSLLFNQSMKADKFYLALPEQLVGGPQYNIPTFLQNYINQGYVTILQPSYDFGAIDKMIHTLPTEEDIFQAQHELQAHQFRILYLDDDMIYDPSFVKILSDKSQDYPDCAVALSGARLRSQFRQIGHTDPRKDRHPYLFYRLGGIDSFGDQVVDIVQGFMGVLVRLSFFNVTEFVHMAANHVNKSIIPGAVRRSDDFAICGYLEYRDIIRRCVDGGLKPVSNAVASRTDNLGKAMYRNAMGAASYLQSHWGIWQNYTFVDYDNLPEDIQHMIDCEAGHVQFCPSYLKDPSSGRPLQHEITRRLDQWLNVSSIR